MRYFVSFKEDRVECLWEREDDKHHPKYIKSTIYEVSEEQFNNSRYLKLVSDTPTLIFPDTYYRVQRSKEYPSISEQLDMLYHSGIFPGILAALTFGSFAYFHIGRRVL